MIPYETRRQICIQHGTDDPWEIIAKLIDDLGATKRLYGSLCESLQKSGVAAVPLNGEPIQEIADAMSQHEWVRGNKDSLPG